VLLPQPLQIRLPPFLGCEAPVASDVRFVAEDEMVCTIMFEVKNPGIGTAACISLGAREPGDEAEERAHHLELDDEAAVLVLAVL
jgi:hypothetical protein